jgi:cytochrome c oxidase subunit 1
MVASVPLDLQMHDSYFVVAHFHYVLIGGAVFPLLGAVTYWFPKFSGRMMTEPLGKWNVALSFVGFHLTFFPMHIVGLIGMPRRTYTYEPGFGWTTLNLIETIGAFIIALAVLVFLVNIIYTSRRGKLAGPDPWDGRSLEWSIPSPPPEYNFAEIPRVEARDDWWHRKYTEDAEGRLVRLPAGGAIEESDTTDGTVATVAAVEEAHNIHMPSPSFYPLVVAAGLPFIGYAAVFLNPWLAIPGVALLLFGVYAWGLEPGTEPSTELGTRH